VPSSQTTKYFGGCSGLVPGQPPFFVAISPRCAEAMAFVVVVVVDVFIVTRALPMRFVP
jgi:hypothetical protein